MDNIYILVGENGEITYPYHLYQLGPTYPDVSFPANPPNHLLAEYGVFVVVQTEKPSINSITQECAEGQPEQVGGAWRQTWVVTDVAPEVVAEAYEAAEAQRIAALWQAAHDYEFAQISGSAIGLLAMGVMMGKPKCLMVQGWVKSIWTTYYARKASGSHDTDFSGAGPCPHSVPELMAELGV